MCWSLGTDKKYCLIVYKVVFIQSCHANVFFLLAPALFLMLFGTTQRPVFFDTMLLFWRWTLRCSYIFKCARRRAHAVSYAFLDDWHPWLNASMYRILRSMSPVQYILVTLEITFGKNRTLWQICTTLHCFPCVLLYRGSNSSHPTVPYR